MKIKLFPFFLLLLQLGACSSDIDDRIYGTWVDPFGQSESVIFREDGTVSWFGEEGTFEAYHDHKTRHIGACNNQLGGWFCFEDDYTERGLQLTLPSRTQKLVSNENCLGNGCSFFDDNGNHWRLAPDWGSPENSVLLFRKSALVYPLMPEPFERLGEGWGFPENEGFPWNGTTSFTKHPIVASNPLRAGKDGDYYVYNETNATWEKEQTPEESTDNKVVFDCVEGDNGERIWKASLDHGSTWKTLPVLSQERHCRLGHNAVTETSIVRMFYSYDDEEYQLWTINAASESPLWVLRNSFDASGGNDMDGQGKSLYVHPTNGTIAWIFDFGWQNGGQKMVSEISHDFGATWKTFDLFDNEDPSRQCYDTSYLGLQALRKHSNGFYCLREDDNRIRWYDFTSQEWTTHDVGFQSRSPGGFTPGFFSPTDGLYIRRGPKLIKWQPDGTETLITTLSGSLGEYGTIYIFDDQVIVNKFGFWRIWR